MTPSYRAMVSPLGVAAALCLLPCFGLAQARYPRGTVRDLTPYEVDTVRALLNSTTDDAAWIALLHYYFRDTYSKELPDFLAYLKRDGTTTHAFTFADATLSVPRFAGDKFLYVHVFSDGPLSSIRYGTSPAPQFCRLAKETAVESPALAGAVTIYRSSVDYKTDPFLRKLLTAFGALLGGAKPVEQPDGLRDTATVSQLALLGRGRIDTLPLYVALAKLPIAENTWNRVSVCAAAGWRLPGYRALVANFANAGQSPFALGLSVGAAFNARDDSDTTEARADTRFTLFMYGTYYPVRPTLPARFPSIGLTFGTSIAPAKPLDDLLLAVSFGQWFRGSPNLHLGASFFPVKDSDGQETRRARFYAGVGFDL